MECMVRLVRLGVGGNFFHTLEPKTFFVGSVFVLTSFIGFVITIKNVVVAAFHLVFTAFIWFSSSAFYLCNVHRRMITSLPASSFETSFQFPFSSFHSFVSTSNQIGSPSSPNFPMIIFIAIGGRVLVSVPTIPFFREQFLKYARLIFACVHTSDSFKRCSV